MSHSRFYIFSVTFHGGVLTTGKNRTKIGENRASKQKTVRVVRILRGKLFGIKRHFWRFYPILVKFSFYPIVFACNVLNGSQKINLFYYSFIFIGEDLKPKQSIMTTFSLPVRNGLSHRNNKKRNFRKSQNQKNASGHAASEL